MVYSEKWYVYPIGDWGIRQEASIGNQSRHISGNTFERIIRPNRTRDLKSLGVWQDFTRTSESFWLCLGFLDAPNLIFGTSELACFHHKALTELIDPAVVVESYADVTWTVKGVVRY